MTTLLFLVHDTLHDLELFSVFFSFIYGQDCLELVVHLKFQNTLFIILTEIFDIPLKIARMQATLQQFDKFMPKYSALKVTSAKLILSKY